MHSAMDLAAAILDGEGSVARPQAGETGNREPECEQRKENKGLPHHAPSIRTQRVPRVIFM
jgi:hypothetical protein